MSRHLLTHVLFASLLLACGATKPLDGVGPSGEQSQNTRIRLTVQGATRVTVTPTHSTTLRFAATLTAGGAPVQGLPVRFSLQGAGAGSILSSQSINTDDNGIALVVFTAGSAAATTRVVAAATDASNAQVDIVIDGTGASLVNGSYAFSSQVSPLEFMNKNTKAYVYTANIVHLLVNPVTAITQQWLQFNDTTQKSELDTSVTVCYAAPGTTLSWEASAACYAAPGLVVPAMQLILGWASNDVALPIYNALLSVGTLLQTINVGGALEIKTYDATTKVFTAGLKFDSYRMAWKGSTTCSNSTDQCCGHTSVEASKLGITSFMTMCPTGATAAMGTCSADLTGHLEPVAGVNGNYTLSLDAGQMALAYGTLISGVLQGVVFPAVLSPTYQRDANGNVPFQNVIAGLTSCNGSSDPKCLVGALVIPVLNIGIGILDGLGSADTLATASITGATLTDTNGDGQADQLTGALLLTNPSDATSTQSPTINGTFASALCNGDAVCGTGRVCRFTNDTSDSCFTRNTCQPAGGTKAGFADCTQNAECSSGTCITAAPSNFTSVNVNHCYQACAADADCASSGGHCDLHGYLSVLNNGATITGTCVH